MRSEACSKIKLNILDIAGSCTEQKEAKTTTTTTTKKKNNKKNKMLIKNDLQHMELISSGTVNFGAREIFL